MIINIKRLTETAKLPTKGTIYSAGYDLYADSKTIKNGIITYGTGLAIEIPEGYFGAIFMRSSVCKKGIGFTLKNAVGIIDSDYRGEVLFKFERSIIFGEYKYEDSSFASAEINYPRDVNSAIDANEYQIGDKIGQLIILPYPKIEFKEVIELSNTVRDKGGFGSTDIIQ